MAAACLLIPKRFVPIIYLLNKIDDCPYFLLEVGTLFSAAFLWNVVNHKWFGIHKLSFIKVLKKEDGL
jgi:hypothetical protein